MVFVAVVAVALAAPAIVVVAAVNHKMAKPAASLGSVLLLVETPVGRELS